MWRRGDAVGDRPGWEGGRPVCYCGRRVRWFGGVSDARTAVELGELVERLEVAATVGEHRRTWLEDLARQGRSHREAMHARAHGEGSVDRTAAEVWRELALGALER